MGSYFIDLDPSKREREREDWSEYLLKHHLKDLKKKREKKKEGLAYLDSLSPHGLRRLPKKKTLAAWVCLMPSLVWVAVVELTIS